MTDLHKLLLDEIRNSDTTAVDQRRRRGTGTTQWFLEKDPKKHPIHDYNNLKFIIGGEDGFKAIAKDLRAATSTIDLVCWGFDPGMELERRKPEGSYVAWQAALTPTAPFKDSNLAGTWSTGGPSALQSTVQDEQQDPSQHMCMAMPQAPYDTWPRGQTYGDLLVQKAREGVKVKILLWYDSAYLNAWKLALKAAVGAGAKALGGPAASLATGKMLSGILNYGYLDFVMSMFANDLSHNVPDMPGIWKAIQDEKGALLIKAPDHARYSSQAPVLQEKERADYCRAWWKAALSGSFPNLEVRVRRGDAKAIKASLGKFFPEVASLVEDQGMQRLGTHHQKAVLVDYPLGQNKSKPNAQGRPCGYIMGLNSVTDYWDTKDHLFNDLRRETDFDVGSKQWSRKPYRDYAIRMEGQALHCVNNNFVKGWDSAQATHAKHAGGSLEAVRKGVSPTIDTDLAKGKPLVSAQIVRTQPQEQDNSILHMYALASSAAQNYIYLENQYFQLQPWAKLLKTVRSNGGQFAQKAKAKPGQWPPLHLFVVIPQAERHEMVPRTYEILAELGEGASVRGYHKQVQDARKHLDIQNATPDWAKDPGKMAADEINRASGTDAKTIATESARTTSANPKADLQALGIKPLVAMLMTFDKENQAASLLVSKRDNHAQAWQAAAEARQGKVKDEVAADRKGRNIRPSRYREIYIHSKLMLVDDAFTTLGSANLNMRSMAADSELNLAVAHGPFAKDARQKVWSNLAGEDLDGADGGTKAVSLVHSDWKKRMAKNTEDRNLQSPRGPENGSFIHAFEDPRDAPSLKLA